LGQLVENVRKGIRVGFPQQKDEEEKLLLDFRQVGVFGFRHSEHGKSLATRRGRGKGTSN